MKNKFIILTTIGLSCLFACNENEYPTYDNSYAAVNIWLGGTNSRVDSMTYNYSYSLAKDSIMFNARVVGEIKDYDRFFTLEAIDGTLEEAQGSYSIAQYCIKAGEYQATFPIYFDKNNLKDSSLFTQNDGSIILALKEDSIFSKGTNGYQDLTIILKNRMAKPDTWDEAVPPQYPYSRFFGSYSERKYQFMISVLGYKDFTIEYNMGVNYDEETNRVSYIYASYLQSKVKLALEEYNATHSEPLMDEYGYPVTF